MELAMAKLDPNLRVGHVNRRLFGVLVEHMGRGVYGGIFDPVDASADDRGFRQDVIDLTRELGVTVARYPGGNFVSGYRWEDGIGPVAERPTRLDLAWRTRESNRVGIDEFLAWTASAGVEPMIAVNLGTRGIEAAADLVEYCNHPGGTRWSDARVANGAASAHNIALWCLGNEMDGPWQIGHKTADEYGRLAAETAKAIRLVDPRVQLVACGSSHERMPTFGAWETTVLSHTFDYIDFLSLHAYFEKVDDDSASFLASSVAMHRFIESVIEIADAVADARGSSKRIMLSFDEWNVWYQSRFGGPESVDWADHPRLIEDEYTTEDAIVVASLLMCLLRHTDRVGIACLAQLVNVIAPIRAESGHPAWRQTIFHPIALTSRHAVGDVLAVETTCATYDTPMIGSVPLCEVTATIDDEHDEVAVFIVSRALEETVSVSLDLTSLKDPRVIERIQLGGGDLGATNTVEHPDRVTPVRVQEVSVVDGILRLDLPPVSWTLLRLQTS